MPQTKRALRSATFYAHNCYSYVLAKRQYIMPTCESHESAPSSASVCGTMEKSAIKVMLLHLVPNQAVDVVLSYWEPRCTLCDAEKGVSVKDGYGQWQIWCLTCALQLLPDESPWVSPLHAPHSHSCSVNRGSLVS